MSLLEEQFEDFNIIDKTTEPDGYGGVHTIYTLGAPITAAATTDDSTEAQIAQALSEIRKYGIITRKNVVLRQNDIIMRVRDKKTFRITTDADDKATPKSATLNMRRCDAVQITLPSDIVISTNGGN